MGVALQEVLNLFESDRPAAAIEVAVVNKEALETALCPTPPRGLRPRVRLLIKGITALEPCRVVPQSILNGIRGLLVEKLPGLMSVSLNTVQLAPATR